MLIPSSRTLLLRKLMTIGAATANNDEILPVGREVPTPSAFVTRPAESPKSVPINRLPTASAGEPGSAIKLATFAHETLSVAGGASCNASRSTVGLLDLLAIPPSRVAIEDRRPFDTDL